MRENKLASLSMDFSVKIIAFCENIKGHYSIINQLERSATSIGANINEANYGNSKADFISKMHIALKETAETEYWLKLLYMSDYISKEMSESLISDCLDIKRMLIASLNTAKSSNS